MKKLFEKIGRWASSAHAELALGALVVASGLVQLATEEGVGAHHGMILVGAFHVVRAVDGLLEGGELSAEALSVLEARRHRAWSGRLRRLLHTAGFRVALGAAVFGAGLADAWEDAANGQALLSGHWKLGVMLVGVLVVGEALAGLRLGVEAAGKGPRGGPTWLLLERAEGQLRRPWVEVAMAAALLVLAGLEGLRADELEPRAHVGLFALGAHRLLALVPRLRSSAVLVADVARQRAGRRG